MVAVALALLAAAAALFSISSQEQQVQQPFWATLALRLLAGLLVGGGGLACWWLLNLALAKAGVVQQVKLPQTMGRVALGPLAGALVFCLT